MHRTVAAALVAALTLGSVGCGSGGRTETVSRAQLVRRLDAACHAGERAMRRALRGTTGLVAFVMAQRESLQTTIDAVDRLETTGRARAELDAYKHTIRMRLDALGSVGAADRADQRRALAAEMPTIDEAGTRAHGLVLALGVPRGVCF